MNKTFLAKCLACVPISANVLKWEGPLVVLHTRIIRKNTGKLKKKH